MKNDNFEFSFALKRASPQVTGGGGRVVVHGRGLRILFALRLARGKSFDSFKFRSLNSYDLRMKVPRWRGRRGLVEKVQGALEVARITKKKFR